LKQLKFFSLFIIGFILFLGCSAVPEADPKLDQAAKSFEAFAEEALVYVVRPSSLGTAVEIEVFVNEKFIGSTGGSRYLYTKLEPGRYVFRSEAENDSELVIKAEAGKIYYIEQDIGMGFLKARNELVLLNKLEGRAALQECSLSDTNVENPLSKKNN